MNRLEPERGTDGVLVPRHGMGKPQGGEIPGEPGCRNDGEIRQRRPQPAEGSNPWSEAVMDIEPSRQCSWWSELPVDRYGPDRKERADVGSRSGRPPKGGARAVPVRRFVRHPRKRGSHRPRGDTRIRSERAGEPIAGGEVAPRGVTISARSSSEGRTPRARPVERHRGDR